MTVSIPRNFIDQILRQAENDYPHETCGILIGPQNEKEKVTAIYPCQNVQDEYHALDPVNFPRTAETAYFIDPKDLLRIQKEARGKECEMRVIYHSHVNAGAYFSDEDRRIALSEGEPAYPGVSYVVVSVRNGKSESVSLFKWNEAKKDFLKADLK